MNQEAAQYLAQFAPLIAGVAIMLLLMSLKLALGRIRIIGEHGAGRTVARQHGVLALEGRMTLHYSGLDLDPAALKVLGHDVFAFYDTGGLNVWGGYAAATDNIKKAIFDEIAYDDSIISGKYARRGRQTSSGSGLVQLSSLAEHAVGGKPLGKNVRVVVYDPMQLYDAVLNSDRASAILLSLMLDNRLEVIGVCR